MAKLFEKAFVINLPFKKARLEKFLSTVPDIIGQMQVWPAIYGDTVKHPKCWTAGIGAWGCYRSHMQILEHCMQHEIESYIVFEDDAIFREKFTEELVLLLDHVPEDWAQFYLGGQLLHEIRHPPTRVNDFIFMPYNVNRTHAFAVHSRGYDALYNHLYPLPFHQGEHIDHHLGRLHESGSFPVYCSRRWIVGQDEGQSNISGQKNDIKYWVNPEDCARDHWLLKTPVCVFLESPLDVAQQLQAKGWHQGNWLNDDGLDRGVSDAAGRFYPEAKLKEWYYWVQREVIRDKKRIPCLYHPALTWDRVQNLTFAKWLHVKVDSVEDALDAMNSQTTFTYQIGAA